MFKKMSCESFSFQCNLLKFKEAYYLDKFYKVGYVTTILKDKTFRLFHDNRRRIVDDDLTMDLSETILDSKPLTNINLCKTLRFISKFPITSPCCICLCPRGHRQEGLCLGPNGHRHKQRYK